MHNFFRKFFANTTRGWSTKNIYFWINACHLFSVNPSARLINCLVEVQANMKAVEDNGRTGQTVANITAKSLPLYPISLLPTHRRYQDRHHSYSIQIEHLRVASSGLQSEWAAYPDVTGSFDEYMTNYNGFSHYSTKNLI